MGRPQYGSDLIVELLAERGIEYVAMNPGASFRGVHDSLVNYADGVPSIIETLHEKVAVGVAHGYAKAVHRPMAVFTHDLVGLLHASLGVYYAYVDRVPMLVLGGAGPMDQARRRPWIDWIHTANMQNDAVRAYTKWDEHPFSAEAIPDAVDRALRAATMEPAGPVYLAFDADLQEGTVDDVVMPPGLAQPSAPAVAAHVIDSIARVMSNAERPAIVCGYLGRAAETWEPLIELAERLNAAVVDSNLRLSFPTRHPLNITGTDLIRRVDAVLLLDVKDIGAHTGLLDKESVGVPPRFAREATVVDVGFGDLGLSAWATHHGSLYRPDIHAVADAATAIAPLLEAVRRVDQPERQSWAREIQEEVLAVRRRWERTVDTGVLSTALLVERVGLAVSEHDWVLSAGTGGGWATRLWNMDRPHRHAGRSLGTATQIGISLGVALGHRATEGRLVVDLQPDGDLLYDASALWTAAHHRIPLLVVMVNNRLYGNDLTHQRVVARQRGRPVERAHLGISIDDPGVDFAGLARSMGWEAHGPVERPEHLDEAIERAVRVVVEERRPALVDVIVPGEEP